MSAESFQARVARGAAWAFASSWARIAVSLVAFAVIARLIGPASYGITTGAGALIALCQVLVGPALGEAIVQQERLDERLASAYFWLLQLSGLLIFGLLVAASRWIAGLFDEPLLAPLLALYALTVPLTALQTLPEAMLGRHLQFRLQALAGGAGVMAGSAVGIALALRGAGPWSLVSMQLAQSAVQTGVLWAGSQWRPARAPDWRGLAPLLRYSGSSVTVRFLNELDSQLPKVFIGSALGVVALGYYGVARRIFDLLKDLLIVPLNMVALPSIAKARASGQDVPRLFGAALRVSTLIANPAFFGLMAVAPLVIGVLFGPGWEPAVPALQLLALLGLRSAVNSFNGAALRGYGKPQQQVGIAVFGVLLLAVLVPLAAPYGLLAAIGAVVFRAFATWPIAAILVQRLGVYPARGQLTVGLRSLTAAVGMALLVTALRSALSDALPGAAALALCIATGLLSYAGLMYLSAPGEFREALRSLRAMLARRRGKPQAAPATAAG